VLFVAVLTFLDLWDWDGTLGRIHHALYVEVREKVGREASPTTAISEARENFREDRANAITLVTGRVLPAEYACALHSEP